MLCIFLLFPNAVKNLEFGPYNLDFEITSIQYPTYLFQTCVTFLSKIIE